MSLLAQIRSQLTVDVDSMDPAVTQRHTTVNARFCNMTSNQAIVHGEAIRPERRGVLDEAMRIALEVGQRQEDQEDALVERVLDVLVRRRWGHLADCARDGGADAL